jgi:hypothetical protein
MRYTIPEGVLSQELGEEAVLLSLSSAEYFCLNSVGRRIWELLREGADRQGIEAVVQREYEAPPEHVARDVGAFLGRLLDLGLIVPVGK